MPLQAVTTPAHGDERQQVLPLLTLEHLSLTQHSPSRYPLCFFLT
jgi:hypothetical protein